MIGAIIAYAAYAASMHSSVWLGVGTIRHVTAAEIVKNRGMWFKIGEKNLVLFPYPPDVNDPTRERGGMSSAFTRAFVVQPWFLTAEAAG